MTGDASSASISSPAAALAAAGVRRLRRKSGDGTAFLPYGLVPVAGLVVLFGLALLPVAFGHVQHTAATAARHALDSVGAAWAAPVVSGQWVVLAGAPPSREAAAMAMEAVRTATAPTVFGPARPVTRVTERFIWLDAPSPDAAGASANAVPSPGITTEPGLDAASAAADPCGASFLSTLDGVTIEFDSGSAVVSARSAATLDQIARAAACPGALRIEGHTDNAGSDALNIDLSRRRANAVRAALIQRGADPLELYTQGYGAGQPIASNDTEEGRARNRRIEIRAVSN